jgi:hypothetical protein
MTKKLGTVLMLVLGLAFAAHAKSPEPSRRWTETAANASYAKHTVACRQQLYSRYRYRVERTSSRAGVAPAEVQRLFTAHCQIN